MLDAPRSIFHLDAVWVTFSPAVHADTIEFCPIRRVKPLRER